MKMLPEYSGNNRDARFGAEITESQIESRICPNKIKSQSHTVKSNLLTVKSNDNMRQIAI